MTERLRKPLFIAMAVVIAATGLFVDIKPTTTLGASPAGNNPGAPASLPLVLDCPTGTGSILYVRAGATGGNGSIATPYGTLAQAISASSAGTQIRVAGGTYGNTAVSWSGVRHLCGGYSADFSTRDPLANVTTLVGTTAASVILINQPGGSSSVVGFTITGGKRGIENTSYNESGGHIYVAGNIIENNSASSSVDGGGISSKMGGEVVGNIIRNNVAGKGAGIYLGTNGGFSSIIQDNLIENNIGYSDHGGGMFVSGVNLTMNHNTIKGNRIGEGLGYGYGGGAIIVNGGATLSWNLYTENVGPSHAGGLFVDEAATVTLDHELFYSNTCGTHGGGAFAIDGNSSGGRSTATIKNSTFVDNGCNNPSKIGAGILMRYNADATVENSIFWDLSPELGATDPGSTTLTANYNLIRTSYPGTGNIIGVDPLFVDAANHDYHEKSQNGHWDVATSSWINDAVTSPAIDIGNPAASFSLEPLPNGDRVNAGVYGNTDQASRSSGIIPPPPPPPTPPPPPPTGTLVATSNVGDVPLGFPQAHSVFKTTTGQTIVIYGNNGVLGFRTSTNDGVTWSALTNIKSLSSSNKYLYSGDIDSSNNILLTYHAFNAGTSNLFFVKLTYTGSTWTIGTERTVAASSLVPLEPSIVKTSVGRIWVSYTYYTGSGYHIAIKYTDNEGVAWSAVTALTASVSNTPSIYSTLELLSDQPVMLYQANYGGSTCPVRSRAYNGTSWGAEQIIESVNTRPTCESYSFTSTRSSGAVYYAGARAGAGQMVFTSWNGTAWATPTVVNSASTDTYDEQLSTDGTNVFLTYSSGSGSSFDVYKKVFDGTSWSSAVQLTGPASAKNYLAHMPPRVSPGSVIPFVYVRGTSSPFSLYALSF